MSRVLIIYVGTYYTRGAGSRRSCGVWGRRGRWRGGGGMNESYVKDWLETLWRDINSLLVFIALADFDCKWGV